MKGMFVALLGLLVYGMAEAQYTIRQDNITTCSGTFYDSGGDGRRYRARERYTTTICPDGNNGSLIRLFFNYIDIANGDRLRIYDGTSTAAQQITEFRSQPGGNPQNVIIQASPTNTSGCLTLDWRSDLLLQADGWEAAIYCIPNCQRVEGSIATDPVEMPVDTGYVDICPGESVQLSAEVEFPENGIRYRQSLSSTSYEWDIGDGRVMQGEQISVVFEEPGGYNVNLTAIDTFGCYNTTNILQRVRVATSPEFTIYGDTSAAICLGDTLALDAALNRDDSDAFISAIPTEGNFLRPKVRADSIPLPDGDGASYETVILFSEFLPGQTLTNLDDLLSICVNMEHSWMYDLEISIICPDGSEAQLVEQRREVNEVYLGAPYQLDDANTPFPPGRGEGMEYCWSINAPNENWPDYVDRFDPDTLPSGYYRPSGDLSPLLGCPLNGEWTIRVTDKWEFDNGWIFGWGLELSPDLYPNLESFTPSLVSGRWVEASGGLQMSDTTILAQPQAAGEAYYRLELTDAYGCSHETAVRLPVRPPMDPECRDCDLGLPPLPDTLVCEDTDLTYPLEEPDLPFNNIVSFTSHPKGIASGGTYTDTLQLNHVNPQTTSAIPRELVEVCLDLEVLNVADLIIILGQSDNNSRMTLGNVSDLPPGTGRSQVCFSLNATQLPANGAALNGLYQALDSWDLLANVNGNGAWVVELNCSRGGGHVA